MFRKTVVIILALVMILSLVGCNVKEKINEKVTEKLTESVLEKVGGEGTDIDIKDGEITFEGEDGESFTIGAGEWPENGAADLIPEFKEGTITSVMNSDASCMIIIEEVKQGDYEEYLEDIKDEGFTNDVTESSSELGIIYTASSDDGSIIYLSYYPSDEQFAISFEPKQ